MEWDDELDEMIHGTGHAGSMTDQVAERHLDPTDITDPASAYFLLSDDAQDEITGTGKKRMKCRSCGHRFLGEIYDRCPTCDSLNTEEVLSFIDSEDGAGEGPNMRCVSCGHTFVGEIYDRCPECFSSNTEGIPDEDIYR